MRPAVGSLKRCRNAIRDGPGATVEAHVGPGPSVQEPLWRLLAGSLSVLYRLTLSALTPSLRTTTSTRRFCWRPAAEVLSTTGYFGP
jgi:hypothetical protein